MPDRLDRRQLDRLGPVSRTGDCRRERAARPGPPCRSAVLGHGGDRCWRADRQLARDHGIYGPAELVLDRQPGPLLYPTGTLLADRLLRRPSRVERSDVPRAMADG